MGQLVKSGKFESAIHETMARLSILGSGNARIGVPEDPDSLVKWWQGK